MPGWGCMLGQRDCTSVVTCRWGEGSCRNVGGLNIIVILVILVIIYNYGTTGKVRLAYMEVQ